MPLIPMPVIFVLLFTLELLAMLAIELAAIAYPKFGAYLQKDKPPSFVQVSAAQDNYWPMFQDAALKAFLMSTSFVAIGSLTLFFNT